MQRDVQQAEMAEIVRNYTKMDHLRPLVISMAFSGSELHVKWLETRCDRVKVDLNGWFCLESPNDVYPTFEGLAMFRSKQFSVQWGVQLTKLLEEAEEKEEEEEENHSL